jgi:hypothetical protein
VSYEETAAKRVDAASLPDAYSHFLRNPVAMFQNNRGDIYASG